MSMETITAKCNRSMKNKYSMNKNVNTYQSNNKVN